MFALFSKFSDLTGFPLKAYSVKFSLNRLTPGVDNIRHDVLLSPDFCKSMSKLIYQLFLKHTKAKKILNTDPTSSLVTERDEFKHLCRNVLHAAIHQAKSASEIQIDLLAQLTIIKRLAEEIPCQYDTLIDKLNVNARRHEISSSEGLSSYIKIKEKLSEIQQNKKFILLSVAAELYQYLIEVQHENTTEMRESILGPETILPDDVFSNPIIHVEDPFEDLFMMDEYVLIGHRFEDPDSYENLLLLIRSLLRKVLLKIFLTDSSFAGRSINQEKIAQRVRGKSGNYYRDSIYDEIDIWLNHVDNIELLFNSFKSRERYKSQKKAQKEAENLKKLSKNQEKLLNFFYKKFNKAGLMKRIVAFYEMKSVYLEYCPPLSPHQVLQFLIQPKQRKNIASQLSRLKGFYGKPFSLVPLKKKIADLRKMSIQEKKKCLIQFLNDFARYHRDFQNFLMLEAAMDSINLVSEQKVIDLSRENNLLYEFLLPDEQPPEEKPIIHHVVIKADMRDSTHITLKMKEKGLNPASFFNLNFFVPITSILFDYSAEKVFLEGDAIILAISEREDTPEEWYCVARACGIARKILQIVHKYNLQSEKHKLPVLELGIGISYLNSPPTFLFDESNRIMISPAINSADRMSKCTKTLSQEISNLKNPFNLYVFQKASENSASTPTDDMLLRYNVNGIELNAEGFEKLSQEINLKTLECHIPALQSAKIRVHTGKFPTVTGKYHRLIIREDRIPVISPHDFSIVGKTNKKYYEVCTHPLLYEHIETL
ncbi:MAG: hypothetical protein JRE92_02760 [Deltaproteobacteria bacterium]|jgi:hypothetical protein|nr:hypothetical protein [Deltaproteobacteria bacterium]